MVSCGTIFKLVKMARSRRGIISLLGFGRRNPEEDLNFGLDQMTRTRRVLEERRMAAEDERSRQIREANPVPTNGLKWDDSKAMGDASKVIIAARTALLKSANKNGELKPRKVFALPGHAGSLACNIGSPDIEIVLPYGFPVIGKDFGFDPEPSKLVGADDPIDQLNTGEVLPVGDVTLIPPDASAISVNVATGRHSTVSLADFHARTGEMPAIKPDYDEAPFADTEEMQTVEG